MLAIIYQSDHSFICSVMVSFIYFLSFEVLVTFIHLLRSWFIGCLFMVLSSFLSINEFISFCHLLPSLRHSFNCLNGDSFRCSFVFFVHLMNEWLNLPISPKGPRISQSREGSVNQTNTESVSPFNAMTKTYPFPNGMLHLSSIFRGIFQALDVSCFRFCH